MSAQTLNTNYLPGRTVLSEGKEYLYFSGTSYLGMSRNESFQQLLLDGIKQYGINYSGSRISNVQLSVFTEAEKYLAAFTGACAALTVSSGFMAGQLVMRSLSGQNTFFYGPCTHPALWQQNQDLNNQDFETWANNLPAQIASTKSEKIIILLNSLDPLLAQCYDLSWLARLNTSKNITVVIDDSHGLGITGKHGSGIFRQLILPKEIGLIVVSSLGKALGIPGGVILSDAATIQELWKTPFFGGASPPVPAYLHAFLQATNIYQAAREKLCWNIEYFKSQLQNPSLFQTFPNYPVLYTTHNQLYHYLLAHHILISSFSYPTPQSKPITRIVLNSLHTQADIDTLAKLVNTFSAESAIV